MKRLIFLKQEYVDEKKLNKTEAIKEHEKYFQESVSAFKKQLKESLDTKAFKILKEARPDAILIELDDDARERVYEKLRKADIVESIDSIIPKELQ
jgi:hypothetical protein